MNTKPLVSIITPSYNQAAFLEQTIQSVLAQDYPNIEYIIVDGGSTDGSQKIIQQYADKLTWWVSEPDRGQADAINKGFRHAKGEIIAWLNSDDLYLPGAVAQAVTVLQTNAGLGMVYSDAITITPDGKPLNKLAFGDWGLPEFMRYRIICQPAVFMNHKVLKQAGYLDPEYNFLLDHNLWIRLARIAPVKHVPHQGITGLWAAARHHLQAKNVAQASHFSEEVFKLLSWMETQPDLAKIIAMHETEILAGAYRLSARYLLDGGEYSKALIMYAKATAANPTFALKHWHRILYTTACISGMKGIADQVHKAARHKPPNLDEIPGLTNWPGIRLHNDS